MTTKSAKAKRTTKAPASSVESSSVEPEQVVALLAGRFRVQAASAGLPVGSKVEGVLSSAVSIRVGDRDVRLDALFPLDERALAALEVAAVWRASLDASRSAVVLQWQRGRVGMAKSWDAKKP